MKLKIKKLKMKEGYVENVEVYFNGEKVGSIYSVNHGEYDIEIGRSWYTTSSKQVLEYFIESIIDFTGIECD